MEVDEERTTLDEAEARKAAAEWEDGTTVEESTLAQGASFAHGAGFAQPQPAQPANPFRAEGNTTNTTSTAGQTLDELTVEEHARPLPPLQLVPTAEPARAAASAAKLSVVTGTDAGKEFDLLAGKPLSIGRAVDNDVVLTDISVSRKHFELFFEGQRWILRDRGSGNGTLINDRMEDGSCQLQHGDRIEIGNTSFRFDHAASSAPAAAMGWGQRGDDDEARTIAGKAPSRPRQAMDAGAMDAGMSAHDPMMVTAPVARLPANTLTGRPGAPRAGTRPPPPQRARTNSGPVAAGPTPGLPANPPGMPAQPAMLASPNAVTVGSAPAYPAMLAPPNAPTMAPFPAPQPMGASPLMALPMPHGHVPAGGHTPNPLRVGISQPLMEEYPSASPAELAAVGRYPSAPMMRPSVSGMSAPAPMMVAGPPARGKTRWVAIGAVGVLVASIGVAAAALGGSAAKQAPPQITAPSLPKKLALGKTAPKPDGASTATSATATSATTATATAPAPAPVATGPTVQPIIEPAADELAAAAAAKQKAADELAAAAAKQKAADELAAATAKQKAADEAAAKQKLADDAAAAKQAEQAEQNRLAAAAAAARQKTVDDAAAATAKKADQQRVAEARRADAARKDEERRLARDKAAEDKRLAAEERRRDKEARAREQPEPTSSARVATADVGAAQSKANTQYESGDFRAAAATLNAAAKTADTGDADDLRSRAADYKAIQDGITAGKTEATTKSVETLSKLKRALALDKRVGGVHASEIQDLIANVAPRAAVSHMTKSNFEQAFAATEDALRFGAGGHPNVKSVRKSLESKAGELYSSGNKSMPSDEGKAQLQRVLKIVPKDNVWYGKAQKALAKG